jgi:hypothetical protein
MTATSRYCTLGVYRSYDVRRSNPGEVNVMSIDVAPPPVALFQYATGYINARAINVVARLGIADQLHAEPKDAQQLAAEANVHAPSLYRVLRTLAGVGIFTEDAAGRFTLTPMAEPLKSDAPGSLRDFIIMLGEAWYAQPWEQLMYSVETGQPAFEHVHGMGLFKYLARHPEAGAVFDSAMTSRSSQENDAITAAYDFSGIRTIIDVGGGRGALLATLLRADPGLRGILFDRPPVAAEARGRLERAGLDGRCEVVGGDFFESIPAGGDAYLLQRVIHDWDDDQALAILRNCRRAMNDSRLLIIELVIPAGNDRSLSKLFDLVMLVQCGGQERTEAEYRTLLAAAGFELTAVTPTRALVNVLECVPV